MKNRFLTLVLILGLIFSPAVSRADLFGGDVAVLMQILVQAIEQLAALKNILGTASDTLGLLQEINKGINDSLNLINKINPNLDPGLYRDWDNPNLAIERVRELYGGTVDSPEVKIQKDADQSVAEAVSFNNDFYKWSGKLDALGESIKDSSHQVSPGGAQKLTAQALGLMIQVMNQNLRAQATSLKLQAQTMAIQNHGNKEATKEILTSSDYLKNAMKAENTDYKIPRF